MGSGGCGRFLWQAVALGHTVIVANCIRFQNQIRLTGTVGLGSLVPRIAKPDGGDVPNINTDCSYTLSYDARRSKGAATVTATSVFGAMYAMGDLQPTGHLASSSLQLSDAPVRTSTMLRSVNAQRCFYIHNSDFSFARAIPADQCAYAGLRDHCSDVYTFCMPAYLCRPSDTVAQCLTLVSKALPIKPVKDDNMMGWRHQN